jgi:ABC-type uncharacterized transport system permease subunit
MPGAAIKEHLRKILLMVFLLQTKKEMKSHLQLKHSQQILTRDSQEISVGEVKVSYSLLMSLQSSLNSLEFKGRALLSLTGGTVLCNTDHNEFLPLNYQCMFVQNSLATCVHFGYSLFLCTVGLILEETLDGIGLLRTGSSKYG